MSDAASGSNLRSIALKSVELPLRRRPGPLLPQILAALALHGRPLRWAITAVAGDALLLEAVVLIQLEQP